MSLKISSTTKTILSALIFLVVQLIAISAGLHSNDGLSASTNSSSLSPTHQHQARASTASARSIYLPFKLNSEGNVVIPGLYDSLGGIITPIQGQVQFRRLVLGLDNEAAALKNEDNDQRRRPLPLKSTTLDQNELSNINRDTLRHAAENQTISLVQFYMATCPDCQGFSPYFKRFAQSIEPHWQQLVRIYTVNCNDFLNIHLCQEENPKLIVPMVRWYVMPIILNDSQTNRFQFNYSKNLLNIAHRQFIEKQRRDLISLRRATIRFINLMLDELSRHKMAHRSINQLDYRNNNTTNNNDTSGLSLQPLLASNTQTADEMLLDLLPLRWHQMEQLGSRVSYQEVSSTPSNVQQFIDDLNRRSRRCTRDTQMLAHIHSPDEMAVINFIVFETRRSFIGRTLAADWSNFTCSPGHPSPAAIFHHTSDISFLNQLNLTSPTPATTNGLTKLNLPVLLSFNSTGGRNFERLDDIQFRFLASNVTSSSMLQVARAKRYAPGQGQLRRPERLQQRASLQKFYTRSQPSFRYASSMVSGGGRRRRSLESAKQNESVEILLAARMLAQAEADNINWAPEMVYPNEERLRYEFNSKVVDELQLHQHQHLRPDNWRPPGSPDGNPGEINIGPKPDRGAIVQAKDDDTMLLLLTDYYRGLDELVHVDLLSKGDIDFHQLLAGSCFLKELIRYFPFQGNVFAPDHLLLLSASSGELAEPAIAGVARQSRQSAKSIARHYLQLIRVAYNMQAEKQLGQANLLMCSSLQSSSNKNNNNNNIYKNVFSSSSSRLVNNTNESSQSSNQSAAYRVDERPLAGASDGNRLRGFRVKARDLERSMEDIRRKYDVGLPPGDNFSWKYCAGSNNYLRGHTCSLWLLFHTLTVHEYLERLEDWEQSPPAYHLAKPRAAPESQPTTTRTSQQLSANSSSLPLDGLLMTTNTTDNKTNKSSLVGGGGGLLSSAYQRDNAVPLSSPSPSSSSSSSTVARLLAPTGSHEWSADNNKWPNQSREAPRREQLVRDERDEQQMLPIVEYKFQIDYSRPPRRPCDPKSPDEALLASTTGELFVNQTQYVLANIINFVRFYLPCTNCAAHFSCMIEHSPKLSFDDGGQADEIDSHLLWLWEGHNRVNERTRGTHSEDPTRPKHIFPAYEACPLCYIERPTTTTGANATIPFTSMRFNRRQLVKFLVARYRRSAILNNKINIEDLYKKRS